MPRRDFVADLKAATDGAGFENIKDVRQGNDDNEVSIMVYPPDCLDGTLLNCLIIPDVGDYPKRHSYMLFANPNAPKTFADRIENAQPPEGKRIQDLLKYISTEICSEDIDMIDASDDDDELDEFDDMLYSDGEYFGGNGFDNASKTAAGNPQSNMAVIRERIRSDLLLTKAAGFKVGYYGDFSQGAKCYVFISIRVSKLGISDEAMQAWHVEPNDYLIVAISYDTGYVSMDDINKDGNPARLGVKFRVGMSHTYKPTYEELLAIWDRYQIKRRLSADSFRTVTETVEVLEDIGAKGWHNTFISHPLNQLLNEKFLYIVRSRYLGMSWAGAEQYIHDSQGRQGQELTCNANAIDDKYMTAQDAESMYPDIVTSDHIEESPKNQLHSFPLLAMQFMLRHFVRCTEFCLVCHCRLDEALEAIKPYVCERPLCLYQYMSLGFGPSMEHELLAEPLVVDLLISFCWLTASSNALKVFPDGLGLNVPDPEEVADRDSFVRPSVDGLGSDTFPKPAEAEKNLARFDAEKKRLTFSDEAHGLKIGDWIQFRSRAPIYTTSGMLWQHHRVLDCFGSSVSLSGHAVTGETSNTPADTSESDESSVQDVYVVKYGKIMDDLNDIDKSRTIAAQLDLLPSVEEMRSHIRYSSKHSLADWPDRISPAALGILRWVIASNRACIMQVSPDARVAGVCEGWAQFRFAMGAPDKEKRFIKAVNDTQERLGLRYPTLFAWHGSPIHNWHSIIREGLHFNFAAHGRAFGNGVYFSQQFQTSLGYSGHYHNQSQPTNRPSWARTKLGVTTAMSLNEVVNAPDEYVSKSPHYVVNKLDWIQTRYLFVRCTETQPSVMLQPIQNALVQDPTRIPTGDAVQAISLPAVVTRRPKVLQSIQREKVDAKKSRNPFKHVAKRLKIDSGDVKKTGEEGDDVDETASIATLAEDLDIFDDLTIDKVKAATTTDSPNILASVLARLKGKAKTTIPVPKTDFVPGSLDHTTLPLLNAPETTGTSSGAEKQLMVRFKALQAVQNAESIVLLGWYIDPNQFENLFQWIVEFHTFDEKLPLAQDMKKKNMTSIVLELRFQENFPFSPPFVRVIRPRLLPFQQGGGGHVTAGGSLCMQLLTNDGWLPSMDIESVLVSIRQELTDLEPHPARLDTRRGDYGISEAVDGYIRACNVHGWRVPENFGNSILTMDH